MFEIVKGKPQIEAKALFVPEFKKIYDRDRTVLKARANKELAYVYFMGDYQSEYNIYGIEKASKIISEVIEIPKWEPDEVILMAIKRYEELQMSHSMRYLKSIRSTVDSLILYYNDLQYKGLKKIDKFNPKPVMDSLKGVEDTLEKIEKWEKKVRGEEESMQIRGGGNIGLFEDKEKATWLRAKS